MRGWAGFKTGGFPPGYPSDIFRFYSPVDDVHGVLEEVLSLAQHSIVLNMYGYDDDRLDDIIRKAAANPRVYVQMSLDRSQAGGVHEKAILAKWNADAAGTSIAIGQSSKHAISHLKVLIVDGLYLVTGSTNWSLSGEQKQDNELTLHVNAVAAAEARSILDRNHAEMVRQQKARAA